jgi:hypothetical protein
LPHCIHLQSYFQPKMSDPFLSRGMCISLFLREAHDGVHRCKYWQVVFSIHHIFKKKVH